MPKNIEANSSKDDVQPAEEFKTAKGEKGLVFGEEIAGQIEQRHKTERAKKFEIPEDIKHGTAGMVWHELGNQIELQREKMLEEQDERGSTDVNRRKLFESLVLEQILMEDSYNREIVDFHDRWKGEGMKTVGFEEGKKNIKAEDMADLVQKHEIDPLEERALERELTDKEQEKLSAAKSLHLRLSKEIGKK